MAVFQPVMHPCTLSCQMTSALMEKSVITVYLLHVCIFLWKCVGRVQEICYHIENRKKRDVICYNVTPAILIDT
jgi:hypothetical protein